MDDLISRQAALDCFHDWIDKRGDVHTADEMPEYQAIEELPSAQPERQKGEWARNFDGNEWYWFCSNCKEEWYEEDLLMGGNDFPKFCPNCGADMREKEE